MYIVYVLYVIVLMLIREEIGIHGPNAYKVH
jgi:hypothetical protein